MTYEQANKAECALEDEFDKQAAIRDAAQAALMAINQRRSHLIRRQIDALNESRKAK